MANEKLRLWNKDSDESVARSRTVFGEKGDQVKATFTITHDAKTYVVEDAVFDFSGCTPAEILELATSCVIIRTQTRAKIAMRSNLGEALKSAHWARIDVKRDVVETERKAATPLTKAANMAAKLTPEERAALLKMLSA